MFPEQQIIRVAKEEDIPVAHINKLIAALRREIKGEEVLQSNIKKVLPRLR